MRADGFIGSADGAFEHDIAGFIHQFTTGFRADAHATAAGVFGDLNAEALRELADFQIALITKIIGVGAIGDP